MGSPSPASPITKTTQTSEMDPRLYQWMYGTPNSPGRLQIANAAMLGRTMQGVQNADPTALAAFYNVPKGTDLSQFQSHTGAMNPGQADPGLMQFPGVSVTPRDYYKEATAGDKKTNKNPKNPVSTDVAAQGGLLDAEEYAEGGRTRALSPSEKQQIQNISRAVANGTATKSQIQRLNNIEQRSGMNVSPYSNAGSGAPKDPKVVSAVSNANNAYMSRQPGAGGPSGNTPLSLADAQIGTTAFYDPTTMQSTNPYYNRAVDVLNQMGTMPGEYQQASDAYNKAISGLSGLTNYSPQQVTAQQIEAAKIARGDIRDVNAQQAQVERMQGGPNVKAIDTERAAMEGPETWTQPGVSQKYMSPYMQNVVDIQKREANRDFAKQMAQLNAQAVGQGAYGGARHAIERSEARRNQAQRLGDIQAQGLQQSYGQGMGQFQNESQLLQAARQSNLGASMQANLANQSAGMTAQQLNQMYGSGGFGAQQANMAAQNQAYNNYVHQQLTAQLQNQGMDWNTASQNATMQMQASIANQSANLQAGMANQSAGLQANQQNIGAYGQMMGGAQGLLGVGQGMGAYNQNLLQNWGAAGNTLQNLAQGYYDRRQQSAQNIWGGVGNATQQATGTLSGAPWGTSYQGQYQQRKKGGKLSIKV